MIYKGFDNWDNNMGVGCIYINKDGEIIKRIRRIMLLTIKLKLLWLKFKLYFGALTTLSVNTVLFLTVLGEKVLPYGFLFSTIFIFSFLSIVKIALGNATKTNEKTDWLSIGSFVAGSCIATIFVLILGLLAIV